MSLMRFDIRALLVALICCAAAKAADDRPFGIPRLVPWTGSRVIGTPDPPHPYDTERVYPHIKLEGPLDLAISPDGQRWFACEDKGLIYSFAHDNEAPRADLFLDIRRKDHRYLNPWQQRRFWSLTFHPKFAENGYVYVCYADPLPQPSRTRISRFTVDVKAPQDPPVCDIDSEFVVCEWLAGIDHFGGCLKFGPDGFLYFTAGDGSAYADGNQSGQDLSDFNAAVMRIDVDRTDKGKAYAVPRDNPFVDRPGAKPEIWAYGTRNIWKMSFDRQTGELWGGDVGQDLWDWIVRIEKGGNYGWSIVEGSHTFRPKHQRGPTPILKPVVEHEHSEARSITGGFVYRGQLQPDLQGTYIYGDFETGKIWGLRYDARQGKLTSHRELADTAHKIVAFGEDQAGELVIVDYTGTFHRLVPAKPATQAHEDFPRLLSQTGLFESTADHRPAAGLIPYSVNSPLWSDGAKKERFIALPDGKQLDYSPNEAWKFPQGAVLVKTFALEMRSGEPDSRRRLETRLLHLSQNHWRGYTYVWNEQQTDAELLDAKGLTRKYTVHDPAAPGGKREQSWRFPSRAECTLCHTMSAGFVLGLNTLQMNKDHDYGAASDNQLRTLDHLGVFKKPIADVEKAARSLAAAGKPIKPFELTDLARLPDPHDESVDLDRRARSYLHANCAQCHMRWGGGNALFELVWRLPLDSTGTVNTPPMHGDLGISGAKLLVPGDPDRSLIYARMNKLGEGRMPHVSSFVIDEPAVALMGAWIEQLGKKQ